MNDTQKETLRQWESVRAHANRYIEKLIEFSTTIDNNEELDAAMDAYIKAEFETTNPLEFIAAIRAMHNTLCDAINPIQETICDVFTGNQIKRFQAEYDKKWGFDKQTEEQNNG